MDVTLFFTIPLFLVMFGSNMVFYYFILTYKKLTRLFLYIENGVLKNEEAKIHKVNSRNLLVK